MQSYEGYLENGQFHPITRMKQLKGRKHVIVTILDEPANTQSDMDTWANLDKIILEMDEKPHLEDFPRCELGREPINFEVL